MYLYPIFTLVTLIWGLIFASGSHLQTSHALDPEFLVKSMGVSSVRFPVLHIPHGKKTQPGW